MLDFFLKIILSSITVSKSYAFQSPELVLSLRHATKAAYVLSGIGCFMSRRVSWPDLRLMDEYIVNDDSGGYDCWEFLYRIISSQDNPPKNSLLSILIRKGSSTRDLYGPRSETSCRS